MLDPLVTLKTDVVIEPLVERWHAWAHLVSPATSCLNAKYRHLAVLESFVSAPEAHVAACQNPNLRGGPFVDLPTSEVGAVKALIESTKAEQAKQIEFGDALRESFRMISKNADGFSIEPHYEKLPEPVRGYVELTYTIGGHPDLRVNEPLLYRSPAYNRNVQSSVIYRAQGDLRPFAFSTPKMPGPNIFELQEPFDAEIYDYLARLRHYPQPRSQVLAALKVGSEQTDLFSDFLTEAPVTALTPSAKTGQTRWRYFGHACVLVEAPDGTNVLIDPIVAYEGQSEVERYVLSDLPEHIDYVVLTHNHADHVLIETLLALRFRVGTVVVPTGGGSIADPSLKLMLQSIGFKNVIELDSLGSIASGELSMTALPFLGEHGDLDVRSKAAWCVRAGQTTMLFAADSNNLDPVLYDLLRQVVGRVDILFIGMECAGAPFSWTYGPLLPVAIDRKKDQTRRLNGSDCEKGLKVVKSLGCTEVYVYAMGAEPWLQFVTSIDPSEDTVPATNARQLVEACQQMGIKALRLFGRADVTI
ncbi:MAG: MBL fold metallo-hydrolase [Burkholderiaceae bacterium]|nr:MBL fold metallo-hydrolase [Burkholderiaceae bacterium]